MFVVQISYTIPTRDGRMTQITSFRTRLAEATQEAAIEAFAKYMENYPYTNEHKDRACFKSLFVEKKIKAKV